MFASDEVQDEGKSETVQLREFRELNTATMVAPATVG